jgi:transcription termination/antitermination protein NusG
MQIQPQITGSERFEQPGWCALHTRYQYEKSVATILTAKGFEVFLPTYRVIRRWTDRNKELILPLFPGYLFFGPANDRQNQILSTPGVHSIIKTAGLPAVIPYEEIESIRRMVESSLRVEPHPFLQDGDRVRIKSGPLTGLEGILSRKKDAVRLVLSVILLGRAAAVEIDACAVEHLRAARPKDSAAELKPPVRAGISPQANCLPSYAPAGPGY